MNARIKKIVENMDNMRIGADDEFKFGCRQCGKCCMNREDIMCNPKDVFRISKKLGISTYDFIKRYCDTYLGDTSHMPIVRIVPHDAAGHCPLLENNKCVVHECKPTVCAMFPIGRCISIDRSKKEPKELEVGDIQYIFVHPDCDDKSQTHTVREWLGQFGIPMEDEYFIEWNKTMATYMNNIFNFGRDLPAPFDTLSNKKVGVSSKYGDKTTSTLCATMIKAIHAVINCMQATGEGAVGVIDQRTVAEYKSSVSPDAYHLVVYDSDKGSIMASVYDKGTESFENYVLNSSGRDGAAVMMALFPVLMTDDEFEENFNAYRDHYTKGFTDFNGAS